MPGSATSGQAEASGEPVPPHRVEQRLLDGAQPGAQAAHAVPASQDVVGLPQDRLRAMQDVEGGLAAAVPAGREERAVAGEVRGMGTAVPVDPSVVLVGQAGADDPQVPARDEAAVASLTSRCGSVGTAHMRWRTRSSDSHGDSERPSIQPPPG